MDIGTLFKQGDVGHIFKLPDGKIKQYNKKLADKSESILTLVLKFASTHGWNENGLLNFVRRLTDPNNPLIDLNVPENADYGEYDSALTIACMNKYWKVAEILIANGADTSSTISYILWKGDNNGSTKDAAIEVATKLIDDFKLPLKPELIVSNIWDDNIVELLLTREIKIGPDAICKSIVILPKNLGLKRFKQFMEHISTYMSKDEIVSLLGQHDVLGQIPLHLCCQQNVLNIEVARILLELGIDPNQLDCRSKTPLHYLTQKIISEGLIGTTELLENDEWTDDEIEQKDMQKINDQSWKHRMHYYPYDQEIKSRKILIDLLIKYGADKDIKDKKRYRAIGNYDQ